jgi:putative flippase GtrA
VPPGLHHDLPHLRRSSLLRYCVQLSRSGTPVAPETLLQRALVSGRALIVGSGATLVDFSVLVTCIRVIDIAPTTARIPALIAGASVQFFGNRTFTFHAQRGKLSRQAKLFVGAEVLALVLNWTIFRLLAPRLTFAPPELVSFLGTFIVFIGFAYPMRKRVIFRLLKEEIAAAAEEEPPPQ